MEPRCTVRVGIGGWTYVPWRGAFYPPSLRQKQELHYASRRLTSIEINSTHYRVPPASSYAKWRAETPDGFVFSLKAPRFATDRRHLADAGPDIARFVGGGLADLGDRLGPLLWQLPPHRRFKADEIEPFLALLPRAVDGLPLRHALDVRNASFRTPEFLALARAHGVAAVFNDGPEYPSFADVTADFVYARLTRSDSAEETGYPPAELDAWAQRAQAWCEGHAPDDLPRIEPPGAKRPRDVFVYFISGAKERAPAAAQALIARLGA
jgi:uncharacterized protein YecE (DUF72 family)